MSSATFVPETTELSGDDAWQALRQTGRRQLLKDAFLRLRFADGFSHSRSMAFLLALVFVQGIIALVGLASALDTNKLSHGIVSALESVAPGPSGRVLTQAVRQAREAGNQGEYLALTLGLVGTLISGTTAMGQLERGLNRIYGVEQDRPMVQKYGRAFLLAISVGALLSFAFLAIGFGPAIDSALESDLLKTLWTWLRWPVALALMTSGIALLFRWCPRRRQPSWSWLAFGAAVSVVLWFAVTLLLSIFFRVSTSFGETYGPLAGLVALLIWGLLSSMSILFGGAVAAQLEAVRAGVPTPKDQAKAEPTPSATPSARVPSLAS